MCVDHSHAEQKLRDVREKSHRSAEKSTAPQKRLTIDLFDTLNL